MVIPQTRPPAPLVPSLNSLEENFSMDQAAKSDDMAYGSDSSEEESGGGSKEEPGDDRLRDPADRGVGQVDVHPKDVPTHTQTHTRTR